MHINRTLAKLLTVTKYDLSDAKNPDCRTTKRRWAKAVRRCGKHEALDLAADAMRRDIVAMGNNDVTEPQFYVPKLTGDNVYVG